MNTVLVVDDEPLVVTLVSRVLTAEGLRVLTTSDPEEAIAICRHPETDVDVLLTDLMMPVMNGRQLRDQVVEILPSIGAIFMSGYTDSSARALLGQDIQNFLLKPFSASSLLATVHRVLDQKVAGLREASSNKRCSVARA